MFKSILISFFATLTLIACGSDDSQRPGNNETHLQDSVQTPPSDEGFDFENAVKVESKDKNVTVYLKWNSAPHAGLEAHNIAEVYLQPKAGLTAQVKLKKLQPRMKCCGTKPPQKQKVSVNETDAKRLTIEDIYFHAAGPKDSWVLLYDITVGDKTDHAEMLVEEVQ